MLFMTRNGSQKRRKSGSVARSRLKNVLLSERMDCSTDTMQMMQNDLVQFQQNPPMVLARIPILQEKDYQRDYVKTI